MDRYQPRPQRPREFTWTITLLLTWSLGFGVGLGTGLSLFIFAGGNQAEPTPVRVAQPAPEPVQAQPDPAKPAEPTEPEPEPRASATEASEKPASKPEKPKPEARPQAEAGGPVWAGRHLFIAVNGQRLNDSTRELLEEIRPGGVVLRSTNMRTTSQTLALVQSIKDAVGLGRHPSSLPIVAVAQEGGLSNVLRLAEAPSARQVALSHDEVYAQQLGEAYAAACLARGIGIVFGPVMDVYSPDGIYPDFAERSFGTNQREVTSLGLAMATGLQNGGVLPVAKFFPGYGSASYGRDGYSIVIERELRDLARILLPFNEAIKNGVPGLIVGHVALPALDTDDPTRPASLSPVVLQRLLRERWGFEGVVLADDIAAASMNLGIAVDDFAVDALSAGNDGVILMDPNPVRIRSVADAIAAAATNGDLPRDRLDAAAARLDEWQRLLAVPGAMRETSITVAAAEEADSESDGPLNALEGLSEADAEATKTQVDADKDTDSEGAESSAEPSGANEEARRKARGAAEQLAAQQEAKRKAEAEAARLRAEQEAKRKAEEEEAARLAAEEEAKRKAEEEAAQREAEEEAKRIAEEKAAQLAAEQEAKQKAEEEEAARLATEAEAKRKAEEEEARLAAEEEAKRKAEEEEAARLAAEEEAKREAEEEEARLAAEEEAKRKAEEEEAARLAAEAEAKRKAEEEAAQREAEEEAKRIAEEKAAQLAAEQEAKRKAEEEAARLAAEEEAKRQAEEEAAQLAAEQEAKRKAEEEAKRQAEEEAKRNAEEEEAARLAAEAEAKRKAEEEAARLAAEEEAKRKAEEEAERLAAAEAEAKRKAEEEAARLAAEEEARQAAEQVASADDTRVSEEDLEPLEPDPEAEPEAEAQAETEAAARSTEGLVEIAHGVQPGDTLMKIAAFYSVRARDIQEWNGLTSDTIQYGTTLVVYVPPERARALAAASGESTLSDTEEVIHVVSEGDTLTSVSQEYAVELRDLVRWNQLTDARLRPGQELRIFNPGTPEAPAEQDPIDVEFVTYRVQPGDTLSSIARTHNATNEQIMRLNDLANPDHVWVGQRLKVPQTE